MQAAVISDFVSLPDYLAVEETSQPAGKMSGTEARVALPSLKITLPLSALHEGI